MARDAKNNNVDSRRKTWACKNGSREGSKSHQMAGTPLLRRQFGRDGLVQPGEEKGPL